jgi:tetratricopeptide (TPR) repeat protein
MSVSNVAELIDRGIKAYLAGRVKDALQAFQRVLALEPGNAKARGYIVRIHAVTPATTPVPSATPRPAPLPGAASAPVPLPGGVAARAESAPRASGDFAASPWDEGPAAVATYVLEPEGGLDLAAVSERPDVRSQGGAGAAPTAASEDVAAWLGAARELFALGDFTGSLELIEKILRADPGHAEARAYLAQNEATLTSMYESKLGPLTAVPRLAIKPEEILWLNLDHRAGFLLSQIDGAVDYQALFAIAGLPRLETARILANLVADGVIAAR